MQCFLTAIVLSPLCTTTEMRKVYNLLQKSVHVIPRASLTVHVSNAECQNGTSSVHERL